MSQKMTKRDVSSHQLHQCSHNHLQRYVRSAIFQWLCTAHCPKNFEIPHLLMNLLFAIANISGNNEVMCIINFAGMETNVYVHVRGQTTTWF